MRKLLLASAAMVGTSAAFTGFASAQAPAMPVQTVIPPAQSQLITAGHV